MVLDVTHVLRTPGERLPFQFSLDLSDMEFSGRRPISRPVAVEGEVCNSADVLTLSMTVSTTLDAVCDRCGKAFLQEKTISYSCMLAEELQNEDNDDIVLLESGRVDAGELARTALILLNGPQQLLVHFLSSSSVSVRRTALRYADHVR